MKSSLVVFSLLFGWMVLAEPKPSVICGRETCPNRRSNVFCRPIDHLDVVWREGRSDGIKLNIHVCTVNPGGPARPLGDLNLYVGVLENPMGARVDVDVENCSVKISADPHREQIFRTDSVQFDAIYAEIFEPNSERRLWRMNDPDQSYAIEESLATDWDRVFRQAAVGSGQVEIRCKVYAEGRDPMSRRPRHPLIPHEHD